MTMNFMFTMNFQPSKQKPSLYRNISSLPDITSAPDPDSIPELPASFFDKGVKPGQIDEVRPLVFNFIEMSKNGAHLSSAFGLLSRD